MEKTALVIQSSIKTFLDFNKGAEEFHNAVTLHFKKASFHRIFAD
jgi:hypothetical protein